MGLAVLTILISVLLGTLLAFLPRQKAAWMGPLRTFGLAAAISVVGLHMLPESIESVGAWAVPALLLGLALPLLLGRLGSFLWRVGKAAADPRHLALEAGYAGLLLHKVGDGLALGVYAGELHPGEGSRSFAAALAAHIVPVVAIVVLTFDSVRGRGSALLRALGLALAGLLGVFLTHSVVLGPLSAAHGWLSAIAAGMLLHVVTHDLGVDLPTTGPARVLDLCMAALGLSVSAFGGVAHGEPGSADVPELLIQSFLRLALETGPVLVLGLLALAWVMARFPTSLGVWLDPRLDDSTQHEPRGVVVARQLTALLFGLETLALTVVLLGTELAIWRGGAALLVTSSAVLAVSVRARPAAARTVRSPDASSFLATFDALVLERGSWVILGLLLAALVDVSLPTGALGGELGRAGLFALLALASYLCPPGAIPLGLVLVDKGLNPGLLLTGLLLGPCASAFVRLGRSRWFERSSAVLGLFAASGSALACAWLAERWLGPGGSSAAARSDPVGVAWLWAAGLSALMGLRAVYEHGFRGFLQSIEGGSPGHVPRPVQASGHHGHSHGLPLTARPPGPKIPGP